MSLSRVSYVAGAAQTDFTITFDYLAEDYVEVYIDGVLQTVTTHYTFFNATTIRLVTPAAGGEIVQLKRNTKNDARLVDFQDAGNLTEADLDLSADQVFHLQQENIDDTVDFSLQLDGGDDKWDAESKVIKNVADPTNAQDAVTKTWAETAMTSQVAAASASAAAALVSENNAAASEAAADADAIATAADAVSTAADAIATAADRVQTGLDVAATNADVVSTNADAASTAADVISTAADAVSTAADAVSTAADVVTVAGIYDDFDDRYLGDKASDPTLDNDGDPLLTGALYFNTTTNTMKAYTGSAWTAAGLTNVVEDTTPQLGGDLDVNGNDIVSVSNGNINVVPNGTGEFQYAGEKVLAPDPDMHGYVIYDSGEQTLTGTSASTTLTTGLETAWHTSTAGKKRSMKYAVHITQWAVSGAPTAAYDKQSNTDSAEFERYYDASGSTWQAGGANIGSTFYGPSFKWISRLEATLSTTTENNDTVTFTMKHNSDTAAVGASTVSGYRVVIVNKGSKET